MRSRIEVFLIKDGFVFAMIRNPESWLKFTSDKPITMSEAQFNKEYVKCSE